MCVANNSTLRITAAQKKVMLASATKLFVYIGKYFIQFKKIISRQSATESVAFCFFSFL